MNVQKMNFDKGFQFKGLFELFIKGKINKIINDISKAITPPNLLGIERRIA